MTKEESIKAIEVMAAYSRGEDIEFKWKTDENWESISRGEEPMFNFADIEYRIKKERTYRPFENKEECLNEVMKHYPFGLLKTKIAYFNILRIEDEGVWYIDNDGDLMFYCFLTKDEEIMFMDGTPFGVIEEE